MQFAVCNMGGGGQAAGEDPHDAASRILLDIDRGLRSPVPSTQLEALAQVAPLLDQYPIPVIVNTALLKLGDVFHGGSNLMRYYILRAMQHCQQHVHKVINKSEVVKRFAGTLLSNDSESRTLTLRTLATMSGILLEAFDVHQGIFDALDAPLVHEVHAALVASQLLCAQSRPFAELVEPRLSVLISDLARPTHLKIAALSVFQHMHHSAKMASHARHVCLAFMKNYPSERCAVAALDATSRLASEYAPHAAPQATLLLATLASDPRRSVRLGCLRNLAVLLKGHAAVPLQLSPVLDAAGQTADTLLQARAIALLLRISKLPLAGRALADGVDVLYVLRAAAQQSGSPAAPMLARLLFNIANTSTLHDTPGAVAAILSHLLKDADVSVMRSVAAFVRRHPQFCAAFCSKAVSLLSSHRRPADILCLLRSLALVAPEAALGPLSPLLEADATSLQPLLPGTVAAALPLVSVMEPSAASAFLNRVAVALQTSASPSSQYDTAVRAMRNGAFELSSALLSPLEARLAHHESYAWWLRACALLSSGEQLARRGEMGAAGEAFADALARLLAAEPARFFQASYVTLRLEITDAARAELDVLRMCAARPGSILLRRRLGELADTWTAIADKAAFLRKSHLDIDASSASLLGSLEAMCLVLSAATAPLSNANAAPSARLALFARSAQHGDTTPLSRAVGNAAQMLVENSASPPAAAVSHLISLLISLPVPVPRYFFVSAPACNVELSLRSSPRGNGDARPSVTIEGIVRGRPHVGIAGAEIVFKTVAAGHGKELNSAVLERRLELRSWLAAPPAPRTKETSVSEGYFEATVLLDAPRDDSAVVGYVRIVDVDGRAWECGPEFSVSFQKT